MKAMYLARTTTVFGLAAPFIISVITSLIACSSNGDSPTCGTCDDAGVGDAGHDGNASPDAGHPDADAGPAPCTGPKGDNILIDYGASSSDSPLPLTGDRTYLYWEGCGPEAGPGSGVCKASKSTGIVSRMTSGRYGRASPLAADDTALWYSPGGTLRRVPVSGPLGVYNQVAYVEAIAFQKGVTPYATYFSASGMLWVSKPSAIEPVQVPGAPSGQFLAIGSTIAYILEKAGKVHRFDIVNQVALGTLDVGPVSGAAWLNSALFFAESAGTSGRGSLKRVDDGSNTATTLFDVASPEWLTADDDALYYADQNTSSSGAAVLRLSKTPGATPSPIATGYTHVTGLSIDSACVYFFASSSTHSWLRVYPKNKP